MQKIYGFAAALILMGMFALNWISGELFAGQTAANKASEQASSLVDNAQSALKMARDLGFDLANNQRIKKQFEIKVTAVELSKLADQLRGQMAIESTIFGTGHSDETIENAVTAAKDMSRTIDKLVQITNVKERQSEYEIMRFTVAPRLTNAMGEIQAEIDADRLRYTQLSMQLRFGGPIAVFAVLFSVWAFLILPSDRRQIASTLALKHKHREAEELAKQAKAANEAKTRFLSSMSHELRTPLNGVIGLAECAEPMIKDGEARDMIGTIKSSGEHLIKIVNEILDFSKIESGSMTLENRAFDPHALITNVKAIHTVPAEKMGIALKIECLTDNSKNRIGDSHRIMQILNNLIGNSIKFTKEGHVHLILSDVDDLNLKIEVRDTGIGMTQDQMGVLFDDFVQADETIARRFGGTGLGMSITKRLVEAMDGTIYVKSELGLGTTFVVDLPLLSDLKSSQVNVVKDKDMILPASLRILAVDDNKTNRLVLRKMLERLGAKATICENGPEAVQSAKHNDYDVYLFDISMPGMDGIECLEAINWHQAEMNRPSVPAIAVTANTLPEQVVKYQACGFERCLAKPIRATTLYEAISDILEKADLAQREANIAQQG
jgi:signal transduction histidine kinase/ActR/RegA family two-component response regulator